MKKLLMITMATALLIGVFAWTAWGFGGPGAGKDIDNRLNLTLEQQQKILVIRQDFQKDTLSLRNDLRKKQQELRQLWGADSLAQGAIDNKTKEVNALRVQMVNKMRAMQKKIKAVLTAEQLKKLEEPGERRGFKGPGRSGGRCFGEDF